MRVQRKGPWIAPLLALLILSLPGSTWAQRAPGGGHEAYGASYEAAPQHSPAPSRRPPPQGEDAAGRLRYWNEIALSANALDHTPVAAGERRVFGEQLGPGRTSQAFAIVHIAIF